MVLHKHFKGLKSDLFAVLSSEQMNLLSKNSRHNKGRDKARYVTDSKMTLRSNARKQQSCENKEGGRTESRSICQEKNKAQKTVFVMTAHILPSQ